MSDEIAQADADALAFAQTVKADAVEIPLSWPGDGSMAPVDQAVVKGRLFKVRPQGPPLPFLERIKTEFAATLQSRQVHVYDVIGRGRFLAGDGHQHMLYPKDHPDAGTDRYVWFVGAKAGDKWAPVRLATSADTETVRLGYLKEREDLGA